MLFILSLAILNLILGYCVGVYLGSPVPWPRRLRRDERPLNDEIPPSPPQTWKEVAPLTPQPETRPVETPPSPPPPLRVEPTPPTPSAFALEAPISQALRALKSNFYAYRRELGELEQALHERALDDSLDPTEIATNLQLQTIQLRGWREELATAIDEHDPTHEAVKLAKEILLSLDTYLALGQSLEDKHDALSPEDRSTMTTTLRESLDKLIENVFPLRDRIDAALLDVSSAAGHHDSADLWDEEFQITSRAGLEATLDGWFRETVLAEHPRRCAAFFDVDRCREINQSGGVYRVNPLLRKAASLLADESRTDDLLSRYSGQRFVLLMQGLTLNQACEQVDRLRAQVEMSLLDHDDVPLTVTCGVAECKSKRDSASLFRQMDDALQAAKQAGRNRTFFPQGSSYAQYDRQAVEELQAVGV